MRNPDQAVDILSKLKCTGVNLSIDDFGTGYSSFSYLVRLPIDELKIDRSFLFNFNENSQIVVESIISLAHRLNLKVIAEGVETADILGTVEGLGCNYVQGYYFCKPASFDDIVPWIEDFNHSHQK